MILTGHSIFAAIERGDITIAPFDATQLNPNSYNYRLGQKLKVFDRWDGEKSIFRDIEIAPEGIILQPGQTYLGHTLEVIGSGRYAMSLIGRSSLGRLGLFLQVSANLGHTGSCHRWTLELVAAMPIRLYAGMKIGQVSFWENKGQIKVSPQTYALHNNAQEALNEVKS